MTSVKFPHMRREVIEALRSLADPDHQRRRWGRVDEGVNAYDDFTLNVNILYDDCQVLPLPEAMIGSVLYERDVAGLRALETVLGPLLDGLGGAPDSDYLADPRWPAVVDAAQRALATMLGSDG